MSNNGNIKKAILMAGKTALKYGAAALKIGMAKLAAIMLVAATALVLILGMFVAAYILVFEYPRIAVQENMAIASPYFEDDAERLQELVAKYETVSSRWAEGLEAFERLQAEEHRVPTAMFLALDQVLGDPVVSTESEWASNPEKIYNSLKPEFFWKDSQITATVTYEYTKIEELDDPELGPIEVTVTHTAEDSIVLPVRLLKKVNSFEGLYLFEYKPAATEYQGDNERYIAAGLTDKLKRYYNSYNVLEVMIQEETLESKRIEGPYFESLKDLVFGHELSQEDFESILYLAMAYDPSYERKAFDMNLDLLIGDLFDVGYAYTGPKGDVVWPSLFYQITSGFGSRLHPISKIRHFHGGVDISGPGINRTPVYSVMNGEVIFAGVSGSLSRGYGRLIIISHGDLGSGNTTTHYAHLSSIHVRRGDEVKAGDIIGTVGSTGSSTGPHLHFEYRVNNAQKNPFLLIGGLAD